MAMGLLSGKYRKKGNKFEKGDIRNDLVALFSDELFNKCLDVVEKLDDIAKRQRHDYCTGGDKLGVSASKACPLLS